jgi:serine/threonine protein kinase
MNSSVMYKQILWNELKFPLGSEALHISAESKDILKKLLIKYPKERLGSKLDYEEVLAHPFFVSIDRKKLIAKEVYIILDKAAIYSNISKW